MLDKVALFVIAMLMILFTAVIVWIGSIPGKIARRRNHPWPDAVNVASWIGLATGIFWPVAFIWAYLPVPAKPSDGSADTESADTGRSKNLADLQKRLVDLEAAMKGLQSQPKENSV